MTSKENIIDIDDPRYRITPMQQVLASCTGAIVTSLLVTPLDVVKIRLQSQKKAMSRCFLYCNGLMDHLCGCSPQQNSNWYQRQVPGQFNGTIDAFVKIGRHEGISSLWSGLSPTLVLAIPATIIYFVTYEQLRLKLKDNYNLNRPPGSPLEQPAWIPLVSGGTARVFSVSIVSPLELIRTKMQSTRLSYYEIGDALKNLIQINGIAGLWRGVFATLLRDVPFSALYWTSYENIKAYYNPTTPSFTFSFVAGAISGGIAATVTVPFDVVKTHQQIEIGNKVLSNESPKPDTTATIIKQLYREFGIKGLFTGLVPRLVKVAPACAIMIATFEHSKIAFNRLANTNRLESNIQQTPNIYNKSKEPSNLLDINVDVQNKELL